MSLPSAQKARRAQLQADISRTAEGMVTTPAAPTLTVVPDEPELDISLYAVNTDLAAPVANPPQPAAAPAVDWEAEAKKNEQRWHTLQGLYERERAEREALAARLNQNSPLPQPGAGNEDDFQPVVFDPNAPELDFTDEERETYSQSLSVIERAAKREAMKLVQQAVEPLTREINQLRGASRKLDDMTEKAFLTNVRRSIPDLDTITSSDAWKAYAGSRIPFTGMTVGQALMQAHNARDLDRVVEIFDGYRGKATSNAIASLTAPAVSGAAAAPRQAGSDQKPRLKWSERTKAHEAFVKGRLTHERLKQIDALYKQADAEGRVDYNS